MLGRFWKVLLLLLFVGGGVVAGIVLGLIPPGWIPPANHQPPAPAPVIEAARQPLPIPVTVTAAVPRSVERRVRTVGTLNGFEEIDISPLVDGHVRRVVCDVGDVITPGDVLLEIDDTDFQLTVREHARALELELSRLGLEKIPDAAFTPASLPSVQRARLVERNAAAILERNKGLADRSVITRDDYEKAELNLETARLDTQQRIIDAEQTLAAVRHREAVLEIADKRLRDTKICAPAITVRTPPGAEGAATMTYTVAERFVSEGEIVRTAPPMKLFRLVVDSVLKLRAAVPERYEAQVKRGQEVNLAVESLPRRRIVGRVSRVNPTVDTANRTFEVEVCVPNEERLLKAGSFATASILVGADADAVTVPEEGIVRYAGVTKIFTVVDSTAHAVAVELGTRLEIPGEDGVARRWVEVSGGVSPGTLVVTTGHSQLSDGVAVRVREASGGESAAAAEAAP